MIGCRIFILSVWDGRVIPDTSSSSSSGSIEVWIGFDFVATNESKTMTLTRLLLLPASLRRQQTKKVVLSSLVFSSSSGPDVS